MWYFKLGFPPVGQDWQVFWDKMAVHGRGESRELSVLGLRTGYLQMQSSVLNIVNIVWSQKKLSKIRCLRSSQIPVSLYQENPIIEFKALLLSMHCCKGENSLHNIWKIPEENIWKLWTVWIMLFHIKLFDVFPEKWYRVVYIRNSVASILS